MDMLRGDEIAEAGLTDWRKLAQGLHARYLVDDFGAAARFVTAVGEAGDDVGHHPRVAIGTGYVDLKLSSADAIYREDDGTEHVVEWVTQHDVDLADGSPRSPPSTTSPPTRQRSASSSSASTRRTPRPSPRSGPRCSPETPSPRAAGRPATRSGTPRGGYRTCGSATPTSTTPASTFPRRGLRAPRGGRPTNRRRRRRRWDRRRRQRRTLTHRDRRPGRQHGSHLRRRVPRDERVTRSRQGCPPLTASPPPAPRPERRPLSAPSPRPWCRPRG